jgi:hypothetical protein
MAPSSTSSTASSFKESWDIINGHEDHNNNGTEDILVTTGCSTPKAQRFRIPEMSSCPPPPKKRRVSSSSSCVSNLSPMNFFAPPDIELFFFLAFQNIPAWVRCSIYICKLWIGDRCLVIYIYIYIWSL